MPSRYPGGPRPGVRMPQMHSDFNGVSKESLIFISSSISMVDFFFFNADVYITSGAGYYNELAAKEYINMVSHCSSLGML